MTEYTVEFVGTGETIRCSDTETILCTAKIHEGEVEQTIVEKRGFTEEEAEEYALTCMARPNSDLKLERGVYPPSIENDAATEGAGSAFADD